MITHQKIKNLILLSVLFSLISCGEEKEVALYTVEKKNFENIVVVDGLVEPVRSANIVAPRAASDGTVAFIIEDGTYVKAGDTVCVIENQMLQTNYDEQQTRLENAKAGLEKTRADLKMQYALLEAQVKANDAETQIAHLDSLQLQYYSPNQKKIRELELKQVAIQREKYKTKLDALGIIQSSEVRKLEIEIQRVANQVGSVKVMLDQLILVAPEDGIATRGMNPMTDKKYEVGDNAWGGIVIVSIPKMDKMKVKMQASETDFRYVNVGDSVIYKFDALPENEAYGKITNKMPVGKEISRGSKIKLFDIEASIDSTTKMPEPGFTARCSILIKQVMDTITVPQIAVYEQDSMKVVFVKYKGGFEVRQVMTAESSAKDAVITQGIAPGEIVALRRPSESMITTTRVLSDSTRIKK